VRVVIAEDETLLRQGLALMLADAGMEVVDAVGDADALRRVARAGRPDVVVTDIRMPPHHTQDGLDAAVAIRAELPRTGVVVLSQYVHRHYALRLLGAPLGTAGDSGGSGVSGAPDVAGGGVGYLLKQRIGRVEAFCADVRRVGEGGTALDPEVIRVMMSRSRRLHGSAGGKSTLDLLTPRQLEVLALIAEGRSNAAIAARLGVSDKAVVNHAARIYDALGLPPNADDHRRVLAVVRYLTR
jgi:DNA-binding NarL/FixJ family response regulator